MATHEQALGASVAIAATGACRSASAVSAQEVTLTGLPVPVPVGVSATMTFPSRHASTVNAK